MPIDRDGAISELVAVIGPALAGIPTQWPNGPDVAQTAKGVPWCRVTFRHAQSRRATLGVRRERHTGVLFAQFMLPIGTGATLTYSTPKPLLEALTDCRTSGGVWVRDVSLYEPGAGDADISSDETDGYYVVTVHATFTYDEIRG